MQVKIQTSQRINCEQTTCNPLPLTAGKGKYMNELGQPLENDKAVYNWLMIGVVMVMIQIAIGGITRLTGSGLSITEWEVVTGSLPPINAADWEVEFAKYRQTPQYRLLNADFSLEDFKFIFFWEWIHRFWARLLGLVFAGGFIYFLAKRKFRPHMVKPLVLLFALGALQGLVGWIMVASGLTGDAVYVKPTRLALHFVFALGLLAYTFWFALNLKIPENSRVKNKAVRNFVLWLLLLLVVQFIYGALMAGHKAASVAATWPDINGHYLIPAGIWHPAKGMLNFIENKVMIHFLHRWLAYVIFILVFIFYLRYKKEPGPLGKLSVLPLLTGIMQLALGILAVLTSNNIIASVWNAFEWMALLHQLNAMLLLLCLVLILFLSTGEKKGAEPVEMQLQN